jgi:alkylation response protein AidB-like acyl-CoA dehydrogenase
MPALGSCEVTLDDVFVPDEDVLGEVGEGRRQVLASTEERAHHDRRDVRGNAVGCPEGCSPVALERHAFGEPIGQMHVLQHGIADMKMKLETARLSTYGAAWLQRADRPCGVEAATAKGLVSEYAVGAADYGIQILGGDGYADEHDIQRYWRDARLYRIGRSPTRWRATSSARASDWRARVEPAA